jgi:hypothetical protein
VLQNNNDQAVHLIAFVRSYFFRLTRALAATVLAVLEVRPLFRALDATVATRFEVRTLLRFATEVTCLSVKIGG